MCDWWKQVHQAIPVFDWWEVTTRTRVYIRDVITDSFSVLTSRHRREQSGPNNVRLFQTSKHFKDCERMKLSLTHHLKETLFNLELKLKMEEKRKLSVYTSCMQYHRKRLYINCSFTSIQKALCKYHISLPNKGDHLFLCVRVV